ncbi:hypothetical protein PILCRDRAFT_805525 [Piloderma croceum F 1598]|uniref:Uncharacterized protein n=1 Tax=Piloderma croceum (strain F 1598) TaxID=765440 RepID=A0A0C3EE36_PILCF|nr:hypothetical protein PILCRDRAFT_805525 [Piloderma croceum F 1598]
MSTTRHESQYIPLVFQGLSRTHRTQQKCRALPAIKPYLRTNRFQGYRLLRRKDNSSRGPRQRHQVHLRCRSRSMSWFRNINRIPFR